MRRFFFGGIQSLTNNISETLIYAFSGYLLINCWKLTLNSISLTLNKSELSGLSQVLQLLIRGILLPLN